MMKGGQCKSCIQLDGRCSRLRLHHMQSSTTNMPVVQLLVKQPSLTKNSQPNAAMAFMMVVGDWGLPPQDSRRRALKSSTGMRGLPTIRVIMVEATLLTDTHSRSVGTSDGQGWKEGREGEGHKPPWPSQ